MCVYVGVCECVWVGKRVVDLGDEIAECCYGGGGGGYCSRWI